jgi:hypothetical protein
MRLAKTIRRQIDVRTVIIRLRRACQGRGFQSFGHGALNVERWLKKCRGRG